MDSRSGKSKSSDHDRSLCEKSMKVVSNIIRISSFSLAERTFGGTTVKAPKEEDMATEIEPLVVVPRFRGSRRLQEPQNRPNRTYVIKPSSGGRNEEDEIYLRVSQHEIEKDHHVMQKRSQVCVDGLASDYIKKIRNQIGCGL